MIIKYIKKVIKYMLLKKKFSKSELHFGSMLDDKSILGKHTTLFSDVILQNSQIGDYSYIQKNSVILNTKIGKFCSIAPNVQIGLSNHPIHMVSTSPIFYDNTQPLPFFFTEKKVFEEDILITTIGSDVWIGQGVIIMSGLNIGTGSIIGAGAIVTKNVEPYSIVVGVPAKHIKYRFDSEIREKLLNSKWWGLKTEELKKITHLFTNPQEMISYIKDKNIG